MNMSIAKLVLVGMGLAGIFTLVMVNKLAPESFVAFLVGLGIESPITQVKTLIQDKQ